MKGVANGAVRQIKEEIGEETTNEEVWDFKRIAKEDDWNYFVKGKELFLTHKHDLSSERVKEIELLFRKAIDNKMKKIFIKINCSIR